jgi:hypothetical protein
VPTDLAKIDGPVGGVANQKSKGFCIFRGATQNILHLRLSNRIQKILNQGRRNTKDFAFDLYACADSNPEIPDCRAA